MRKIRDCFSGRMHYTVETDGEIYKATITSDLIYYYPIVTVFENSKELNDWIDRMQLNDIMEKIEIKTEINDFCGFFDKAYGILLDAYGMKDWGMSQEDFLSQAKSEADFMYHIRQKERENK